MMAFVGNLLWFVFGGGFIAWFLWFFAGCFFAITIIGIPFALAHFKLAQVSFAPLGKTIVASDVAQAARERAAHAQLDKSLSQKKR